MTTLRCGDGHGAGVCKVCNAWRLAYDGAQPVALEPEGVVLVPVVVALGRKLGGLLHETVIARLQGLDFLLQLPLLFLLLLFLPLPFFLLIFLHALAIEGRVLGGLSRLLVGKPKRLVDVGRQIGALQRGLCWFRCARSEPRRP